MAYNASFPKFMLKLISIYLAQPILWGTKKTSQLQLYLCN
jgi:hypothetical protein